MQIGVLTKLTTKLLEDISELIGNGISEEEYQEIREAVECWKQCKELTSDGPHSTLLLISEWKKASEQVEEYKKCKQEWYEKYIESEKLLHETTYDLGLAHGERDKLKKELYETRQAPEKIRPLDQFDILIKVEPLFKQLSKAQQINIIRILAGKIE